MIRSRVYPLSLWEVLNNVLEPVERATKENSLRVTRGVPVNVEEDSSHYLLTAELPGFKKEEVAVTFENDLLTIKAEKSIEKVEDNNAEKENESKEVKPKILIKERSTQSVLRSFQLTKDIDQENVQASFVDGVLSLKLNKKADDKQVIKVQVL